MYNRFRNGSHYTGQKNRSEMKSKQKQTGFSVRGILYSLSLCDSTVLKKRKMNEDKIKGG